MAVYLSQQGRIVLFATIPIRFETEVLQATDMLKI